MITKCRLCEHLEPSYLSSICVGCQLGTNSLPNFEIVDNDILDEMSKIIRKETPNAQT